jgi:predicted esterase
VVLFLHGAGEKGTDGLLPVGGTLAVALERWPTAPFVAVFPQCEDTTGRALTGWLAKSPDGHRAIQILDSVIQDYSIDSQRQALVGWSMGGYGAWSLAAAHSRRWSAVLTLAGGALKESLTLEPLAAARTPVWAINGDDDPLIPWTQSQQLIGELNRLGGRGTFTRLHGLGHDVCQRVFANPQSFDWLLHPDSIDPSTIRFDSVQPLPLRTRFYRESLVTSETIPGSLAIRLGNQALEKLAPDLPTVFPPASLAGELPDITRTFGTGERQLEVSLSQVSYRAHVSSCWLNAISGGRLVAEFGFSPLEMQIGQTTLDSRDNQAVTGPIRISIGVHQPALLRLEVQPQMRQGELCLELLRQSFEFDDGNWYIQPPTQARVQSRQFTSAQVVTGIIGTLYSSRQEIVDQVLLAVPDLLKTVEAELQTREAPELAKALSPLPVLVPEISVAPSAVRTDSEGLSFICDLQVLSRAHASKLVPRQPLSLPLIHPESGMGAQILLQAITLLSQVSVNQQQAQVNVLDISESTFGQLADPEVMKDVLPSLSAVSGGRLRTILRLLDPLVLGPGHATLPPSSTGLVLSSSAVALDIYRPEGQQGRIPVGRIVFRLEQPIQVHLPSADQADGQVRLQWQDSCTVEFLRTESLAGSSVPEANGPVFERLFRSVWLNWAAEHGTESFPSNFLTLGKTRVQLNTLDVTPTELELTFQAVREDE